MTEPSQYFKGRTVQEQMNEVIGYVDVRSAEVATDAIAADVAQVHQDMLDADADATAAAASAGAAAASAAAAAGTLANAVKKTGEASQSVAGDIAVSGDLSAGGDLVVTGDVTGGTVTVPTPVNNTDAASKKYVDDQDALKISITDINDYAVGLTGNQNYSGEKTALSNRFVKKTRPIDYIIDQGFTVGVIPATESRYDLAVRDSNNANTYAFTRYAMNTSGGGVILMSVSTYDLTNQATLVLTANTNGDVVLSLRKDLNGVRTTTEVARL